MASVAEKIADLAGPGIGDYTQLEHILPNHYHSLLTPKETQRAIFAVKGYVEEHLCKELGLMMVTVPLIVDGMNVIGTEPNGWWRDRAAARRRLVDELGVAAERPRQK